MGVRYLQYVFAGILSILSFTTFTDAQQIMLPQPLFTPPPPGADFHKSQSSPAYYRGEPMTNIAPMRLQPSVFPLFIEDDEFSSLITLVNSSGVSSSALLTIRDPQGKVYTPMSIRLTGHAKAQIKVADLLRKLDITIRAGSILVTQGPELKRPSILSQLTLTQTNAVPVALTEEELVMTMDTDSQDLNSISESATDAQLIAVTSLSSEAQHISAQCYKSTGVTTKTATLAPGGTALLYPCSKDSFQIEGTSLLGMSESKESAGITIHTDGPNGGFAAYGIARHFSPEKKSSFLGSLQFIDPTSLQSSALVFTGVSAGYSLTPATHPYSAAVAVANFSTQQNHITIAFHKTDKNGSVSSTTKDIKLAPESSTQVSLGQLGLKAGEIGSLVVSSDQSPGDTMAKIVSSSDKAPNQLEQLAKDSLSHRNGGAHPWTVQDGSRSDLVLFNHFSRAMPFSVLITAEDGVQWNQHLVLAAFETKNISINDLIRNKTPDIHGRIIPESTRSGTAIWRTEGPGIGSGHVLVRNDNNSTGENFSCDQTYVVCGASVQAEKSTLAVGDTGTIYAIESFCVEYTTQGYCGGGDNSYDDYANAASWVSGDSNIISIYSNTTTGIYQGVGAGATNITGTIQDGWGCLASASTPNIDVKPCPTYSYLALSDFINPWDFSNDTAHSTGIGSANSMHVGDSSNSVDYDGILVDEAVSLVPGSNSCPSTVPNLCQGGSTFTVGVGVINNVYPNAVPIHNAFWDFHAYTDGPDVLGDAGLSTCSQTCSQTYTCHGTGAPIKSYTIYFELDHDTVAGRPYTVVHAVVN